MKNQTDYGKLIGRKGNEYYFLDYTFEDRDFKGAVGSVMVPVTKEEAEERRDDWDSDGEMWRMAVEAEMTTMGMDEWHEFVLAMDGENHMFDESYCSTYGEELLAFLDSEENELVECVGGGRCFYADREFDEIYEPDLWELIKKYES